MSSQTRARSRRRAREALPDTFRAWVEANELGLAHPPYRWRRGRRGYSFGFRGVHPALVGWVDDWQMVIGAYYEGIHWDGVREFDVSTDRTQGGRWYCGLCEGKEHRRYYKTPERLWTLHSFEPMAHWIDEVLKPGCWLVLRDYGGMTEAVIQPKLKSRTPTQSGVREVFIPLVPDDPS